LNVGSPINLTAAVDGHYSYWFDQALSPLSVTAPAPSHTSETAPRVVITAGNTTTVNLILRWLQFSYLNLLLMSGIIAIFPGICNTSLAARPEWQWIMGFILFLLGN